MYFYLAQYIDFSHSHFLGCHFRELPTLVYTIKDAIEYMELDNYCLIAVIEGI